MKGSGMVSEERVERPLGGSRDGGWSRFLGRWAVAAAVVELTLLGVAIVWFVPTSEAGGAGADLGELVAAVASPGMYRLLSVLDVLVWVALGGLFIALAAVMAERAPRRSVLLAVCGVGQVTGVAGAFVRMQAVGGTAARHGSAGLEDPIVVESFLGVQDVLFALMNTGALLWALAFVVAATVAWQSRRFARWLAVLLGVLGIVALADVALYMVGGQFVLDVVKFLLLPVVFVAIAIAFRPSATTAAP